MTEEQANEIIKLLEAIQKDTAKTASVLSDATAYPPKTTIAIYKPPV